jgi:hypothetical protein
LGQAFESSIPALSPLRFSSLWGFISLPASRAAALLNASNFEVALTIVCYFS